MYVLTVDQIGSRSTPDRVPQLESAPFAEAAVLPFARTAGDEAQAVFDDAAAALRCALGLASTGFWHCGLGVGPIEEGAEGAPRDAREGRGEAYVAAREAVEAAKDQPAHLCIRPLEGAGETAEAAAQVVLGVRAKQRETAHEASALAQGGLTQGQIAERLGISQQAVSDRLTAAMHAPLERLIEAAVSALRAADGPSPQTEPTPEGRQASENVSEGAPEGPSKSASESTEE